MTVCEKEIVPIIALKRFCSIFYHCSCQLIIQLIAFNCDYNYSVLNLPLVLKLLCVIGETFAAIQGHDIDNDLEIELDRYHF